MQKITFSLRPRTEKRADGTSLVYIILRIDGKRKDYSTNQHIPLKNWDKKKQALVAGKGLSRLEALEKMKVLELIREKCQQIINDTYLSGLALSHELFERKLNTNNELFELGRFMTDFIERNPDNWGPETIRSYKGALKLLEDHFKAVFIADLPDFQNKLEKILCRLGNNPNTRKKRHKQFKTILNRASEAGYQLPDTYRKSIGVIKGNRDFLTLAELDLTLSAFHNGQFNSTQHRALRVFLFCCFTGCRYSDIKELTHKNISSGTLKYIAVKTERFNKEVQVPIPEVAMALIPNTIGKLFEVPTNQVINRKLKEIFTILGLNKHITFHSSRHTFGTLYIYLGGEVTNLQQLMAHSDIDTTMNYVKMARKIDSATKSLFDEKFADGLRSITKGKMSLLSAM